MNTELFKEASNKCESIGYSLRYSRLYEIYIVEVDRFNEIKKTIKGFKSLEDVIDFCNEQTTKE